MKSPHHYFHQIVFLCLVFVLGATATSASAADYRVDKVPDWVTPIASPTMKPIEKGETANSINYLLIDKQIRIDEHSKVVFQHRVSKAADNRGLEDLANINLDFDPSYEALTLHSVQVIRDGVTIDKLKTAKIHVLQRERDLEYLVYDGSKTINIVLQDVRVGDVVDYSYSVSGGNPVFQGHVAGGSQIQWGIPVGRIAVRLLEPEQRAMHVVMHNTNLRPEIRVRDGMREYRFVKDDMPAINVESDAPDWYDPFAEMQWSDYADWAAVVQWALPLYQPGQISAELKGEIARIAREHADPEGRLLAALYLVQHDIRYLGVEIGPGSHAPNPPSLVFQRRFGDCKDKALLLVTVLHELGIDASPALVSTAWKGTIAEMWPTVSAFDHVIVHATLKGKGYWLDATRSPQVGDLAHVFQPNFGLALILDAKATNLTRMESQHMTTKRIHALFDSTKGLDAPVKLTIETNYAGREAEHLLADIASEGKESLEKQYLNFYARDYSKVRRVAPLDVKRDDVNGMVMTTETYEIPDFWVVARKTGRLEGSIKTSDIDSTLGQSVPLHRVAPLKVDFPDDVEQTTEIKFPKKFSLDPNSKQINDSAFTFNSTSTPAPDGMSLTLVDKYSALTDHVDPKDLANYAAHLDEAYNWTGYKLWTGSATARNSTAPTKTLQVTPHDVSASEMQISKWVLLGVSLFTLAAVCVIAFSASEPQHRQANSRLLAIFFGDALLIASAIAMGMPSQVIWVIVAIFTWLLRREILRIRFLAPASHWLNVQALHRPVARRGLAIARRLFWVLIGMALMRVFS